MHGSTGPLFLLLFYLFFLHTSGSCAGSAGKLGYGFNCSTVSFRHCGFCKTDLATKEHNMGFNFSVPSIDRWTENLVLVFFSRGIDDIYPQFIVCGDIPCFGRCYRVFIKSYVTYGNDIYQGQLLFQGLQGMICVANKKKNNNIKYLRQDKP